MSVRIINADVMDGLATLPDESVHCVVTSPPYWGLRDYSVEGQIGLEPTLAEHIVKLVEVFRDVRRVLRNDGTLWLNYGDAYNSQNGFHRGEKYMDGGKPRVMETPSRAGSGLKPKELMLMPERLAIALSDDGWTIRARIIWHKPNPMPESVTDRPTKSHEHIWLMSKQPRYFYDAEAIREDAIWQRENNPEWQKQRAETNAKKGAGNRNAADGGFTGWSPEHGRNARDVWTIATAPFAEAHFATFPPELAERCIKAGCPAGGTVLDPFSGAGTTCLVADRLQRSGIGIELNPVYAAMARKRVTNDCPLFTEAAE